MDGQPNYTRTSYAPRSVDGGRKVSSLKPAPGTTWIESLRDLFGVHLTKEHAMRWFSYLRWNASYLTEEELNNIVGEHGRVSRDRKPNLNEVAQWVKDARNANAKKATPGDHRCSVCSDGWVQHRPSLDESGFTIEQYYLAYAESIPCVCPKGKAHFETEEGEELNVDQQAMHRLAQRAARQIIYYRAMIEQAGKTAKYHTFAEYLKTIDFRVERKPIASRLETDACPFGER